MPVCTDCIDINLFSDLIRNDLTIFHDVLEHLYSRHYNQHFVIKAEILIHIFYFQLPFVCAANHVGKIDYFTGIVRRDIHDLNIWWNNITIIDQFFRRDIYDAFPEHLFFTHSLVIGIYQISIVVVFLVGISWSL